MDMCEDIRLTPEGKDLYNKRKETIERVFGTAKEHHAMRYTQQVGKEKMAMKVGLTFACMKMKNFHTHEKSPSFSILKGIQKICRTRNFVVKCVGMAF